MYIVIGWIALQIAFGNTSQQADRTGALHKLSSEPFGKAEPVKLNETSGCLRGLW
jgi:hypothetical protein